MNCRLCLQEKELRRSHIIPDFFADSSGLTYPTGDSRKLQPFGLPISTMPGKKFKRMQQGYWEKQLGMIEHLLCHDCEQKFSSLENYAKRFFYGNSTPIRLQLPLLGDPFFVADYKKMKLFQLSILWRANEAKGSFFANVHLDDHHRERLRLMLLNDNPGAEDEYFCGMSRLVVPPSVQKLFNDSDSAIETGRFAPVCHRHEGWDSYMFVMGGLTWLFCVSDTGIPEIMRNRYIKETGEFHLGNHDGFEFLHNFSRKAIEAGNVTKADAEESIKAKKRIN